MIHKRLALRQLLRPGDYLVVLLAAALVVLSALHFWRGDAPRVAIVRAAGKVVAQLPLNQSSRYRAQGPLGATDIEVEAGRARVAKDPGPHQYCVKQGWLSRAGAIAICAPNQVSLSLEGGKAHFDSVSY